MRTHKCPKCQGTMAEGVVLTERHGMPVVTGWSEGVPKTTWFGAKAKGKAIEIRSWRCQRCGFLENYAPA